MGDAGVGCIFRAGHRAAAQPRGGMWYALPITVLYMAAVSPRLASSEQHFA
jgi:hypothetical protein